MLKFKTSCAVLANLSSNLLNEVGLSLFRYFKVCLRVCDIVVNKFTFAISSPDEFLYLLSSPHVLSTSGMSHNSPAAQHRRTLAVTHFPLYAKPPHSYCLPDRLHGLLPAPFLLSYSVFDLILFFSLFFVSGP